MELKSSLLIDTLKGAEVKTSAPFHIAKVLRECVLSRYLPRPRQRQQCRTAEARRAPPLTLQVTLRLARIIPTKGKSHDQAHGNETATGCSAKSNPAHSGSAFSEHNSHQCGKSHQGEDPSSSLHIHNESLPRVCMCGCAPPTGNAPGAVCVPSQHTLK